MSAELDLRDLHRPHEPDPTFVAALERRLDSILAGDASVGDGAGPDGDVDASLVALATTTPRRSVLPVLLGVAAAVVLVAALGVVAWRVQGPGDLATRAGDSPSAASPTTMDAPSLPPQGPFVGVWLSTDTDGSSQTMAIERSDGDEYEVVVRDEAATVACSGAPSTMTGTGRLETDGQLVIAQPELTCDDGTTPAVGRPPQAEIANLTFVHDAATDELSDTFGVMWRRDGAVEDGESAPTTSRDLETAPSASPFVGSWELFDADGSGQTMEIAASGDGSLRLTIHDYGAEVCSGGASTTTGVGRLDSNGELRAVEVVVTAPQLTCDDGSAPLALTPPIDEQPRDFRLFHDAESDELGEVVANNVFFWSRPVPDEPSPTPYQPDSAASVPDGWVAFVGVDGFVDDVYVVRGGVQPRRVDVPGSDTHTETCPAFAPDGKRLVFGRASDDGRDGFVDGELVVVTVGDDGSTTEPETIPLDGMDGLPCPIWAPDGRWVAFGGAGAVWVVDTQNGETRRLPDYDPTDLEWRPGSDELAITGQARRGNRFEVGELPVSDAPIDLYSVSAGTTRTLGDVRAAYLTWSPDGATLAFRHGEPEPDDGIWLVDSDGQNLRQLSEGAAHAVHGVDIVWSPRGDQIAFQRRRGCCEASDVVLVTATDTDPANPIGTQRVIAPPADGAGNWLPFSVTWSPDGSHLLYVAWAWDGDEEVQGVIAVPIEDDQPRVVLAQADVSVHGGTPWIPLQQWQPAAASPSS